MAKRKVLGRGLDALLGGSKDEENEVAEKTVFGDMEKATDAETPAASKTSLKTNLPEGIETDLNGQLLVKVELLRPNPHQPREDFDEEKLNELADSVKADGILQPITIEDAEDGTFYIIAGERRTRAAKIAGLEKVPVQLKKYNDEKKLELALIENIQRENLNAIEEAKAFDKLLKMSGMTQDELSKRVGKNRATIANSIRLLKLTKEMQEALIEEKITAGHARALLSVEKKDNQKKLFEKIVEENLNVREAEKLAGELNEEKSTKDGEAAEGEGGKPTKPLVVRDPDFIDLEQQFIDALGTKVAMKGDFNKGTIQIDYFSRADLDKLYTLLTGKEA